MKLYIKNMNCVRCKLLVRYELEKLGFQEFTIKVGEVEIRDSLTNEKRNKLLVALLELGMEQTDDKDSILVEKIKNVINELTESTGELPNNNFSNHLSTRLGYTYKYLSNKFSALMGTSIRKYLIKQKIERVKEALIHDNVSFSQIAFTTNYSSVAYLSNQFKKETGFTPSQFRLINQRKKKTTPEK
jgi:AraC-like DNA-binding protein